MLKVLSEDFSFDDEEFLKVPIWVKFPNLPMKLWNVEAMSEVASMVGVLLNTDKITKDRANHHFARLLIEVDASKPPPLSFPIRLPSRKVIEQSVLYETFPNFCFHCKEYGHNPFICKKLADKYKGVTKNREDLVEETPGEAASLETPLEQKAKKEVQSLVPEGSDIERQVEEAIEDSLDQSTDPNYAHVIAEAKEHVILEIPPEDHPMTRSKSKTLQADRDYYIYLIHSNYDSPHKLVTGLQRYKSSHPEAKNYPPYLQRAIQFHNKYNSSLATSVEVPANFMC
ncbi:unnamed protein product [Cuscuta europaea]|uniref:DUF4283 domain-containing protein n=1 Tax=Cuscuta europaea TaxID=41803 RepID=A0A9P1A0J9_CUSEU|nr:unnamed protein product [Cuscuta europaea]